MASKKRNVAENQESFDQSTEGNMEMTQENESLDNVAEEGINEVAQESLDNAGTEAVEAVKVAKKIPEVEKVTLTDGRIVDFVGRRKLIKNSKVNEDGSFSLELIYRNGQFTTINVPAEHFLNYAIHGASQKFGDTFNAEDDLDDAINAVEEMALRLAKGEWHVEREKGDGKGGSMLVQALVEALNVDRAKVQEFLLTKSVAHKRALMLTDEIKPIIDRIKAEKAAKAKPKAKEAIDTGSLLAEIQAL